MADKKKRTRADSRAHTPCPHCSFRVHGDRGLAMHLAQVHGIQPPKANAARKGGA